MPVSKETRRKMSEGQKRAWLVRGRSEVSDVKNRVAAIVVKAVKDIYKELVK